MRWDEVDLNAGTWTIPATKFQTNNPLTVHLSAPAMTILKRRAKSSNLGNVEWIFPRPNDRQR